uniref:Large ribosomal subunit protein uL23 n=1 Tax=Roseihalotalea indica TaxID=2867963 RepID=A0AA49JIW1_9BACT|nr:50S ribosomal protein L23 [Tunicatimonas sp. TK19036]
MDVLKKPLVTEKISEKNEQGKYGFVVDKRANKLQIREAVEKMYGVTVDRVWTMNYQGKVKNRYTKSGVITGKAPNYKKAIIQVAEGDIIDFYSNV